MRITAVLATLVLAAAAPAFGQEIIRTDWGTFNFERDLGTMSGVVAGRPDSVYHAVAAILADLGVSIKDADSNNLQLSATRSKLNRRLGKRAVSYYLSCGEGLTGPNADNWQVLLTLAVQLTPAPDRRARLAMAVAAEAIDVPNGRSERIPCTTTGQLEYELLRRLRQLFPGTS